MSKTGKWSCVSQSDSNQFGNCPLQWDNEFHWEHDQNPQAFRRKDHWEWVGAGHIPNEKEIESFYRDLDTDTVDDFYVTKEIILGAVIGKSAPNHSEWSIVVRTVIRWEERRMRKNIIVRNVRAPKHQNHKPSDIERWEQTHDRNIRNNQNNARRSRNTNRRRTH